jgi:mono/diheme cytochrome c family protein
MLAWLVGCDAGTAAPEDPGVVDAATDAQSREKDGEPPSVVCVRALDKTEVVPPPYAGRMNPLSPSASVIASGKTRFAQRCALCHGYGGRGDGSEGPFDPPAADLTARVRADDYLFWRLSEGGRAEPFCSAMPRFATLFTEQTRWELAAYVQSLAEPPDAASDAAAD